MGFVKALTKAIIAIKKLFSTSPPTPVGQCPPGAITKEQALKLFKKLAAQPNIPFDYPDDCCFSRAHEMCRIMKKDGVDCRKVWNYGHEYPTKSSLSVDTPNHPSGHVNWRYHVAPVVSVKENGSCTDMVMDPSLFDKPVTIAEWKQKQKDQTSKIEITAEKYYFRGPNNVPAQGDPDYTKTEAMLKVHTNARDRRRTTGK